MLYSNGRHICNRRLGFVIFFTKMLELDKSGDQVRGHDFYPLLIFRSHYLNRITFAKLLKYFGILVGFGPYGNVILGYISYDLAAPLCLDLCTVRLLSASEQLILKVREYPDIVKTYHQCITLCVAYGIPGLDPRALKSVVSLSGNGCIYTVSCCVKQISVRRLQIEVVIVFFHNSLIRNVKSSVLYRYLVIGHLTVFDERCRIIRCGLEIFMKISSLVRISPFIKQARGLCDQQYHTDEQHSHRNGYHRLQYLPSAFSPSSCFP